MPLRSHPLAISRLDKRVQRRFDVILQEPATEGDVRFLQFGAPFPMVPILILVILGLLVVLLSSWRRNRKPLLDARSAKQVRAGERTNELEKANEDLKTAQAELQR